MIQNCHSALVSVPVQVHYQRQTNYRRMSHQRQDLLFDFRSVCEKRKGYVAKGMKHAYEGRYHLGKDVSASRESCVW
mgnify:FL=1